MGKFPWQLSLQTTGDFCGGSIQSGQKIQTNVFISHPAYDGAKIINNFAVGKVKTPFNLNEYAKPIPLVNPSETRPNEGHPLQTSGYGYYKLNILNRPVSQVSRYLKWTDLEYVGVETCKNIVSGITIDNSVICADKKEASVCSGDSGGPLVIEEEGEWRLIGLTSWAHIYCKLDGFPQGWANVQWPEYNAWMREQAFGEETTTESMETTTEDTEELEN